MSNLPAADVGVCNIGTIFQTEAPAENSRAQDIFGQGKLAIPAYQRPYKWQHKHVLQLLQDLQHHAQQERQYRLGTVVLHKEEGKLNVVDGQQRLVTLSLILHCLEAQELPFHGVRFRHGISRHNIRSNYAFIRRYVEESGLDKKGLATFICQSCEMIWVVLADLEEAFQFFDSQNARGKPLAPYDLLKAYHLRAIRSEEPELMRYVETWEQSVHGDPSLDLIISRRLYCLRQWLRFGGGWEFSNHELALFKGVGEHSSYPYLQTQRAGMALHRNHTANPMMYDRLYAVPPFQVGQTIIDGKLFFEYIEHYRRLYRELFDECSGHLSRFKLNGKSYLQAFNYNGHRRTGDRYMRDLFECAVLLYYDKFRTDGLETAANRILHWAFHLRLRFQRIEWGRIELEAHDKNGLLWCIALAEQPETVAAFMTEYTITNHDTGVKELLGETHEQS